MKIDSYLNKLKTDILKEYKVELESQISNILKPLEDHKQRLENELLSKKETLRFQQDVMQKAQVFQKEKQKQERIRRVIAVRIWNKSIDDFFKKHSTQWLCSMITKIPNFQGRLRHAVNVPEEVVKEIQRRNPLLEIEKDKKISYGFVFESDKLIVDCTKDVFMQAAFSQLKHELYNQLRMEKIS